MSQILSGHGGFRWKLAQHGYDLDTQCPSCGVPETAEHVVASCTAYDALRARLSRKTGKYVITEDVFPELVEEENYTSFREFVYGWREAVGPAHFMMTRRGPAPGRPPDQPMEQTDGD